MLIIIIMVNKLHIPRLIKVILIIFLIVFSSSILFSIFERVKLGDAFYWAMCRLVWADCIFVEEYKTTVGKTLPILLGITTIGILWFVIESSFRYVYTGELSTIIRGVRIRRRLGSMKNHFIICGFGRVGGKVGELMKKNRVSFLVIENDPKVLKKLEEEKILTVEGNALEASTLERAEIKKARGLIAALGEDSDNVYLALTAKDLNPNLTVGARANHERVVRKLHKAGADIVVLPEAVGGFELAKEILKFKEKFDHELISKK